jgi:AraC-like DNA-binding protein
MQTLGNSTGAPHIWFAYCQPADHLRAFVSGYHFVEIDTGSADFLEDFNFPGWTLLRFTLGGAPWLARIGGDYAPVPAAALFGVTSQATWIRTFGGLMVGAGVTPLGWARLFHADAADYANRATPLATVLGDRAEALRIRLRKCHDEADWTAEFDAFFTGLLDTAPPLPVDVAAIHRMLVDPAITSVDHVADAIGLTPRHVGRIAQRIFGLPPKLLMRRARFLRAAMPLRTPDPRPLPERVADEYADYAHFARDCHDFFGMSPSAFITGTRPISDASTRERARKLGAPAQALHQPGGG